MLRKKKTNFGTKLLIYFTLLNLISIILPSVSFSYIYRKHIYENYATAVEDMANNILSEANRKTNDIKRVANSFIFDKTFYRMLYRRYEGIERQNIINDYLLPLGNSTVKFIESEISVKLYIFNDSIPEYFYTRDSEYATARKKTFEILHMKRIMSNDEYMSFYNSESYAVWKQVEYDEEEQKISLLCKLTNYSTMENIGIIRINVALQELFGDLLPQSFQQQYSYDVLTTDNKILLHSGNTFEFDKNDTETTNNIGDSGFKIALKMPRSNISKGIYKAVRSIVFTALICFISTLFMVLFFKKRLYKNIKIILDGITKFQKGDYDYCIKNVEFDEFNKIANSLNGFAQNTGHLINDIYEVMIQNQDIEMQMLQAKVNPHFMYNIFNMISQMASCGKNDDIISVVDKSAKFYRSLLSKNKNYNDLNAELNCLKQYFEIVKIQRPDTVEVVYDIEPECLTCQVPNFILQPIVENSIKHAIIDKHIKIEITAKRIGDDLQIVIGDDGIGMTKEQVEQAFQFSRNSGYGLYNINERILLRYGNVRYGIVCNSEYMKGTEMILTLPYTTQVGNEEGELELV